MSNARLVKELKDMIKGAPPGVSAGPIDDNNIYNWHGTLIGPPETPYDRGLFKLSITFPKNYPFAPPTIKFLTQIYHCNIRSDTGEICLDILKDQWSPALTIDKVLISLSALLAGPNPDDPLVPSIATLYKQDKNKHDMKAREATLRYAV